MFEALRDVIVDIDTAVVGLDDLDELRAIQDLLAEKINTVIGRLDTECAYDSVGAPSMTEWLKHQACQTGAAASKAVKTARKLRDLDTVRTAWASGTLSTGHVEVIAANVKQRHVGLFVQYQHDIIERLSNLTVQDAAKVMRWWSLLADDLIPGPDGDDPVDSLHLSKTFDDRGIINGSFSPEAAAVIEAALRLFGVDDPELPAPQRRADALTAICQFALDHHTKKTSRRNRPHLAVLMRQGPDGEPVGETLEGVPVSRSRLQQWLCDALFNRVMTADSQLLDYGHTTPTIPTGLWHAVATRDQGCRFGCDRPAAWCEAHHVIPFRDGGTTAIGNLALFCSHHHHKLHDNSGWTALLHPDGQLDITNPNGVITSTFPPGHTRTLWPPGDKTDDEADDPDPPPD